MWLWSSEHIDFFLTKAAEVVGEQFHAQALLRALVGVDSVEEAKSLVLTRPIKLQPDSYEVCEKLRAMDDETIDKLLTFTQSLPAELVPIPQGEFEYDVGKWLRDVVHYTEALKPRDEPECSSIDKSKYELEFYSTNPDEEKESADAQLGEWLFDAYESVSNVSIEDDEDGFLTGFEEWCDTSEIAKDLTAHTEFLLHQYSRDLFLKFSRPMLNFCAFELTAENDKFGELVKRYGEKALFGVWRFIDLNRDFSGNFTENSNETMCIYDTYGMLCVFMNGNWEQIANVITFDLVIPRGTSDEVIIDRCDAVSGAHLDFAKELIYYRPFIASKNDEKEFANYCASLIYGYSDSDLNATALLLNILSDFDCLAVNVDPAYYDACLYESYEETMYRCEAVTVYFSHIEGRRRKSNEFTFEDMYRALNTMDLVREDEKRDLTEEEAALKLKQEEFAKVLTASLPNYVSLHTFDPWKYPMS